ncbi:hypothetical protein LWI29_016574 [Acer saccharum]|uniref:Protein kinase domain-containing protein n=1 Tax=Acer saccharum TaxID=4024 RepID=A0AA39SVK1_ACESA|nr:hypothetical protein LWI29_016574 [Acer saccharum]
MFRQQSLAQVSVHLLRDNRGSRTSFHRYLYALGHRTNQTGKIYLNSSEQSSCLASLKTLEGDGFGFGIEKLTSGAGGCSDYSVADVTNKLGDELRSLNENCKFMISNGEWNKTCGSCVRSWQGIRGPRSEFSDHESIENEADICRFAVMVTLTSSRMNDGIFAQNVYKCLAQENSYNAFRDVQLKDPGCPKFPIKGVYSATNNLDELNLIGEVTAGKDKVLSWIQRLQIAIDSARGLFFLHTYSEGCIVHRDIKPTNILLGPNLEAKLSDFGLSKVMDLGETYVSSEVRGTFGYVDPEYQSNRQAKFLTRDGSTKGLVDPKLEGEFSVEAFDLTLGLALSCTAVKQQRPSTEEVVATLEKALDKSTTANASTPGTSPNLPSTP